MSCFLATCLFLKGREGGQEAVRACPVHRYTRTEAGSGSIGFKNSQRNFQRKFFYLLPEKREI